MNSRISAPDAQRAAPINEISLPLSFWKRAALLEIVLVGTFLVGWITRSRNLTVIFLLGVLYWAYRTENLILTISLFVLSFAVLIVSIAFL
ncbi:MAG TPA: hypothetical protein DC054_09370 [Blastocatellia bacterium]|nr:hypothetical protein [Blastocatellia bacterium]